MTTTTLELSVLAAIDASEFGDEIHNSIWTFSVWDNIDRHACPNRKSLSGAVSSCVKKGFVTIAGDGTNDSEIRITDAGIAALKTSGHKFRKFNVEDPSTYPTGYLRSYPVV